MPILKSEISGTLKMSGFIITHTHNILQKWLAPTIVLNVSLQNYNTFPRALFQIWYLFIFLEYLCILRKKKRKKNPNLKRSNGDNCAFCVIILCERLVSHTKKAPELTTL